jgi:multiple sugar transport system substrate-binding protein
MDKLVIDPMVWSTSTLPNSCATTATNHRLQQWTEGWFAGMSDTLVGADGNPKKVFSYFLPTWGLPYVLIPNSGDTTGRRLGDDQWTHGVSMGRYLGWRNEGQPEL